MSVSNDSLRERLVHSSSNTTVGTAPSLDRPRLGSAILLLGQHYY